MKDTLGDICKKIESTNQHSLDVGVPVYARLDGKGFSKFTHGMERPYDKTFTSMMVEVASTLLTTTRATLAYVQSDEISLYWEAMDCMDFRGRKDKWLGELVGLATAEFNRLTHVHFPERIHRLPRFDCRVFNVSEDMGLNFINWRYLDCRKNAVSMLSSHFFSHRQLHGVSQQERIDLLKSIDVDFFSYPEQFRMGTFIRREEVMMPIDKTQIPPHLVDTVPDMALRNRTVTYHIPSLKDFKTIQEIVDFNK